MNTNIDRAKRCVALAAKLVEAPQAKSWLTLDEHGTWEKAAVAWLERADMEIAFCGTAPKRALTTDEVDAAVANELVISALRALLNAEVERGKLRSEALEALRVFASKHGRQWRSKLLALWTSGKDTGSLRVARNVFGPSGLKGVSL